MGKAPELLRSLQADDAWLRLLVGQLIRDEHEIDEVIQDARLIALERAGPDDDSKSFGWLRKVVWNLALQRRRAAHRRRVHETAAASSDSAPSTRQILEREDARHAIVDAVRTLDEPYQSVIILRYFEDLPPRVIADRMDTSVATVKTRLARGLQQLRARLDRQFDGDRRAWCAVLLPIAGGFPGGAGTASATSGAPFTLWGAAVMSMKAKVISATVVVVALGTAMGLVLRETSPLTKPATNQRSNALSPTSAVAPEKTPARNFISGPEREAARLAERGTALRNVHPGVDRWAGLRAELVEAIEGKQRARVDAVVSEIGQWAAANDRTKFLTGLAEGGEKDRAVREVVWFACVRTGAATARDWARAHFLNPKLPSRRRFVALLAAHHLSPSVPGQHVLAWDYLDVVFARPVPEDLLADLKAGISSLGDAAFANARDSKWFCKSLASLIAFGVEDGLVPAIEWIDLILKVSKSGRSSLGFLLGSFKHHPQSLALLRHVLSSDCHTIVRALAMGMLVDLGSVYRFAPELKRVWREDRNHSVRIMALQILSAGNALTEPELWDHVKSKDTHESQTTLRCLLEKAHSTQGGEILELVTNRPHLWKMYLQWFSKEAKSAPPLSDASVRRLAGVPGTDPWVSSRTLDALRLVDRFKMRKLAGWVAEVQADQRQEPGVRSFAGQVMKELSR